MAFLKNAWYMAAWSSEIGAEPLFSRTILDTPIVFFRDSTGQVRALLDRCPHRFVPLSNGKLTDGRIQCAYHGLTFDGTGRCVHNPHRSGDVHQMAQVSAFPVEEQDLIIWIWMGAPERANTSEIPDFSFLSQANPNSLNTGYVPMKANYLLGCDNIMDLSHVDYLHPNTLGGGSITRSEANITEQGDSVRITWSVHNDTIPPAFAQELPDPTVKANQTTTVLWTPPGSMWLTVRVDIPGGSDIVVQAAHIMTPETETTTNYYFANTRNFRENDVEHTKRIHEFTSFIFTQEDKPMVEAQQRRMGTTTDVFALKPVWLPVDACGSRLRLKMGQLLKNEAT